MQTQEKKSKYERVSEEMDRVMQEILTLIANSKGDTISFHTASIRKGIIPQAIFPYLFFDRLRELQKTGVITNIGINRGYNNKGKVIVFLDRKVKDKLLLALLAVLDRFDIALHNILHTVSILPPEKVKESVDVEEVIAVLVHYKSLIEQIIEKLEEVVRQ